jgi:restriction system protein
MALGQFVETVMARKGFLTGLHRLAKQMTRESERQRKASQRAHALHLREAASARKSEQQSCARAQKASVAELKRLEKEARELHEAAIAAEVEYRNLNLAEMEEELQGILVATLGVDDFVDLNTLCVRVVHPPFQPQDLTKLARPPLPIADLPMPVHVEPPAPRGLLSFLSKNQYEKAKAKAIAKHQEEMTCWQAEVGRNEGRRADEAAAYEERKHAQQTALKQEQDRYAAIAPKEKKKQTSGIERSTS